MGAFTMTALAQTCALLCRAVTGPYLWCALLAPPLLAFGVVFNRKLRALDRTWLEWSPFHVKANITLLPIRLRWVWLPYALALAFVMPFLALLEEFIFRSGTADWGRGLLWGALAFGVFHLASFVTVRMTIYLTIVGAVFVQLYMLSGLTAVFTLHATYNLLALALVVATRQKGLQL